MDLDKLFKYAAALVLLGSVFVLVMWGKVSADAYLGFVAGALSTLGIVAVRPAPPPPAPNPSNPPMSPEVKP